MKSLIAVVGLGFAAVTALAQPAYNLRTVEARPIPKAEHFELWQDVALKMCKDAPRNHNLSETECRKLTRERAKACYAQQQGKMPRTIETRAVSRDVGRKLLYCATPHYFCGGVEVRTEAEVRATCRR